MDSKASVDRANDAVDPGIAVPNFDLSHL
jgi:hypothetical protein